MNDVSETQKNTPYRVLARKYRPQNFDQLIGQDALVRTLTNAIDSGRIAHAFMLTGVRGVGKTTTARIIAKALNYTGADGKAGPTTGPTDDCLICKAISEDRHPDILEMDAASHTGVDDVREILEGVRYAPSQARYKIYIIDEVHMLSKNAFNALLKTLEEPPAHVKFIFATTEIRKVPITVLSRCQRFDLRRVDVPTLSAHYSAICEKEQVKAEDAAITLIARAADGSVRDGLSILDQAMALAGTNPATMQITATDVAHMLGLADRNRSLDLLEQILAGKIPEALAMMEDLYRSGADPLVLLQDLLDLTHTLTKRRALPQEKVQVGEEQMSALAAKLSMPVLGKTWQILLKGLAEVQGAPNPQSALEMILIRLAYAGDLPDPADLIKKLQDGGGNFTNAPSGPPPVSPAPAPTARLTAVRGGGNLAVKQTPALQAEVARAAPVEHIPDLPEIVTLEDIVAVLELENEMLLASQVYQFVHLIKLDQTAQAGRLEIALSPEAPKKLSQDLGSILGRITGIRWMVSVSPQGGQPTLAQVAQARLGAELAEVRALPIIQEILAAFPEAEIKSITRTQT